MLPFKDTNDISRRDWLKLGGAALVAGGTASLSAGLPNLDCASDERVIFIWCRGGMSHLDSWDPKPGRTSCGEFTAIETSVPGIQVSEIFPRLASQMHHCSLFRSVVGEFDEHVPAESQMLAGLPSPADISLAEENSFALPTASPRDVARYGDTKFGRDALRARQLVERGVRFVHIQRGGFDTHANNFHTMRLHGDVMDPALASLIEDLGASGLLQTTLVAVVSEFGRSPRINAHAGRDHWAGCFSCLLAGGGLPAGSAIGASDRDGYRAIERPITVAELNASIRHAVRNSDENSVPTSETFARRV